MKKYEFSGHLSPRPKGTEHAMCALSGEVYLASDVDAHIAGMTALENQRTAEWQEALDRGLLSEDVNVELRERVQELHATQANRIAELEAKIKQLKTDLEDRYGEGFDDGYEQATYSRE